MLANIKVLEWTLVIITLSLLGFSVLYEYVAVIKKLFEYFLGIFLKFIML